MDAEVEGVDENVATWLCRFVFCGDVMLVDIGSDPVVVVMVVMVERCVVERQGHV